MKVLCAVLLGVVAHCHGYSYLIPARQNQDGVCYFNGHVLPKGDSKMPTACQNLRCNEDGSILVQGCGRLKIKNCTLLGPTQNSGVYPDCCEMNYECKDHDGRLSMRQWNQLKVESGRDDQEKQEGHEENLEQTAEAIKAAMELLDQVRQQAQRDGRIDLRGQSNRVESELLILRQIVDRQGQLVKRGILGEAEREAQDQKRRLQLARMEDALNILVKMSKGMLQLSANERLRDDLQVRQEVEGILEIIQQEIGKSEPEFNKLLHELAELKAFQAKRFQEGWSTPSPHESLPESKVQLETHISLKTYVFEQDLKSMLRIDQADQLGNLQDTLYNLVENIQRQIRVQNPEVRAQLRQALDEIDSLSEIKDREGVISQEELKQRQQEVQIQRRRVDDQLRILAQKWERKVDASEPIALIVRLVREQISRLSPLRSDELPALLKSIENGLQEMERIRIIKQDGIPKHVEDEKQKGEITRRIVEDDLRSVLQMLEQGLREVSQGSQVDQDVLAILKPLRDQILRSRTSKPLQLGQVGDRDFLQLTRTFVVLFDDVIEKQLGIGIPNLRVDVSRVQTELEILSQFRARRLRLNKLDQLSADGDQKIQEAIRKQKEQLEREMAILVRLDMRGSEPEFKGPVGLEERELLQLKEQNRLLYEKLEMLDPTETQNEQQQQEQIKVGELEAVERQLHIIIQKWSMAMENFDESCFSGQFRQDFQVVLDRLKDLIREQEPTKFPRLKFQLKRIENRVNYLDEIKTLREQLEEIHYECERIKWDLWIFLQVLGQGIQVDDELETIIELLHMRKGEDIQNPEVHAQYNSFEEEIRILSELYARQVRHILEGDLNEGQQWKLKEKKKEEEDLKEEIRMQLDRLKRSLMPFLPKLIGRLELVESGGEIEEALAAVHDLARDRFQLHLRQPEAVKDYPSVTEAMQRLQILLKRREGDSQVQGPQLKDIYTVVGFFLNMHMEPLGQMKQEGREIMELAREQLGRPQGGEKRKESEERRTLDERQDDEGQQDRDGLQGSEEHQGREDRRVHENRRGREAHQELENRQSHQGSQSDDQLERVEAELKAPDQLNSRQSQRQKEEKRLQRERLDKELEALLTVREKEEDESKQRPGNPKFVSEGKRLQRLKAQLPKVPEAERCLLQQQINKQRYDTEREFRPIYQIKAIKYDLDPHMQAIIDHDSKEGRRFI